MAFSLILSLINSSGRSSLIEFVILVESTWPKTLCCVIETFCAALRGEWRGHIRDRSILSKYITMSKHKQILFINKSWSSLQRPRSTQNTITLQMMQTCYQWTMTAAQMGLLCTIYWIPLSSFSLCSTCVAFSLSCNI